MYYIWYDIQTAQIIYRVLILTFILRIAKSNSAADTNWLILLNTLRYQKVVGTKIDSPLRLI